MEMIRFRTFHQWQSDEYVEFVCKKSFDLIDSYIIEREMLSECILIRKT